MFKKIVVFYFMSIICFGMEHSFYFSNKYITTQETKLQESKLENERLILPTILEKINYGTITAYISIQDKKENLNPLVSIWNPLKEKLKLNTEETQKIEGIQENITLVNNQNYLLNLTTQDKKITGYKINKIDDEKTIKTLIEKNTNIIFKPSLETNTYYVYNKDKNIEFGDDFVVNYYDTIFKIQFLISTPTNVLFQ